MDNKYAKGYSIRLTQEDRRILRALAEMTTRSQSDVIRYLLRAEYKRLSSQTGNALFFLNSDVTGKNIRVTEQMITETVSNQ